jgi:small GTP-binding protein
MQTQRVQKVLEGHTDFISCFSFSCDGRLLASKSGDSTVRLWRCDTWETVAILAELSSPEEYFAGLAFHPSDPTVLATLGEENTVIRIWNLDIDTILANAPQTRSVHYTTAKIALVGDSGVGKTGLGWRLSHGAFKEHSSTHGQQFWVIGELGATRADGTECEAILWDLAGQPDYRLIHALFLDDVDQALVLFDPANRQEPLKGVEYWLKQLAHRKDKARPCGTILVGARADRGTPTLTQEEIEAFCRRYNIAGSYIGTSALSGAGLPELIERIKSLIDWDAMPATVTTATFKRIKEYVLALKADPQRKGVLVSPVELRAQLAATDPEWSFDDAEMITAVGHLANHGYVMILRGSRGEQTFLLVPELLANLAASFVLEARRNPRGLGALDEARVLAGDYVFAELNGLERHERDVLLDAAAALFLERTLCFRETLGTQTFLIFPALINQKRPQIEEIATTDDVAYQIVGAVENVYAALVVLLGYSNTFTRTNQWQNQAQYETARGEVCGFRQLAEREGAIELVLYYGTKTAESMRLLFQGLFEQFLRGRDVTITRYPPVRCPKCQYQQPRTEVVGRIREGKGFTFCSECGRKITLPKTGEAVALSQRDREQVDQEQTRTRQRVAFEAALVRVKAAVRDRGRSARTPSCFISYAWGDRAHERWVGGLATDLENAGVVVILDQRDNARIGASVGRFISRLEERASDFVVAVGTPTYRLKYENKLATTGSVVAAEVDLINLRLTGTEEAKNTVLPLLLEGDERDALPPLLRGRVYADFRQETRYFAMLFDLILTLHSIPVAHPAIADLRDSLRADAKRRW